MHPYNAEYSNVVIHEEPPDASEDDVGKALMVVLGSLDLWTSPSDLPENGVVKTTVGAFKVEATYDEGTGILRHAKFTGSPEIGTAEVSLVDTNIPGLTPYAGGALNVTQVITIAGIVAGLAVLILILVRYGILKKVRRRAPAPYVPPPPPSVNR